MPNSLYTVFQAIANVTNEQQLQLAVMDQIREYFAVQHCGIYLLDEQPTGGSNVQVIPAVCMENNPVGRYVVERHAPAHEQLILSPGDWRNFCSRHDHEHVMTGPIVGDGRLVGTLNLARNQGTEAFTTDDLADFSALCIHLSAKLATLRAQKPKLSNSLLVSPLTPRELEIAQLVAQGLTNAEIGRQLWITQNSVKQALKRMFRKLGVSARSEMVAKLHLISLN
ncbi:LuxR C-terminal-related transcriptional regulator [Chrysosporum bergii ANA360D]|jgi:DNA-binding CsgD family transcriptional regulator|uniref:LuxR C-terminal-related transcriptional regulator n=1 Tax=Chrysosporum bergii ANA360D TaxID=617107 RepID=A0AA43KBA0_9CYAN|nr:LuxR C-terminal-related transcriptional regulator [Chrysosporum bergii]MDH6060207.1 LuxR C-terminal-related transcriptional regulator [Chrysosporum bergii ANA360D]